MSMLRTVDLSRAAAAVLVILVLPLAGCADDYVTSDDYYVPALHYDVYPIDVASGSVKLDVAAKSPALGAAGEQAVGRFAAQAAATGAAVYVRRPGSRNGDIVAGRVTQVLVDHGISPEAIVNTRYSGGKGAPVVISFERAIAVTPECGDWHTDLSNNWRNEALANFGCAHQHNIAALVSDPNDFVAPRDMTSPDAMRRYQMFLDYRKPKDTATQPGESSEVDVAKVAQ
jgi:pilus assembly protein CpaD